jgi:hypothetical protein
MALVELPEQEGLILTTNVEARPESLVVGMPLLVRFEPFEGSWLPIFVPEAEVSQHLITLHVAP